MTGPLPGLDLKSTFDSEKLEAFLVTGSANVRYVSGFTGSNGVVLFLPESAIFFTDPRYTIQAAQEVKFKTVVVPKGGLIPAVLKYIARKKLRRVGFEKDHVAYAQYLSMTSASSIRLKPVDDVILQRRMVKSETEIEAIRRSVITNSQAFDNAVRKIKPGMRESELAAELEYQMRCLGADRPAFDTIVAAGERSALPHAHPTSRPINGDELLLIDMGASQDGYASDMTRMLHIGRASRRTAQMYGAVLEAQLAALDAIRPGATAGQVDRAARQVLKKHGLAETFRHSTGHGLGLEIHEPPRLGKGDKTRLAVGMAITIEPGAYVENVGGVRIEDTVVVTPNGCDILTPTSKELIAL